MKALIKNYLKKKIVDVRKNSQKGISYSGYPWSGNLNIGYFFKDSMKNFFAKYKNRKETPFNYFQIVLNRKI